MTKNSDIQVGNKSTELGVKPEEWNISILESVAQIIMGQSPPGTTYNEIGEGKPFLQGKAEFGEVNPKNTKYTTDPKKIAPMGSILMSVRAPVGDVNIADIEYCIGRGLAAISLKTGDNQFLFFLLQHLKDEIEKEGTGSIFKSINKAKLLEFEIPLPPIPEQYAIATTLRTVQEAKEKTDAVIAATKALKAAMMKHLFTYGPVPPEETERVTLKETEIGQVPEGWGIKKLGDLCPNDKKAIQTGPFGSQLHCSDYVDSGIPVVMPRDITDNGISTSKIAQIGISDYERLKRHSLRKNDIVLGRRGEIGRRAIIQKEQEGWICGTGCLRIRILNEKILPKFLNIFLSTPPIVEWLSNEAIGTTMQNLSSTILKSTPILLPDIQEQNQIVNCLDAIDQKLAAEQSRKEALNTLFASLLHDLMTAKIRVKNIA